MAEVYLVVAGQSGDVYRSACCHQQLDGGASHMTHRGAAARRLSAPDTEDGGTPERTGLFTITFGFIFDYIIV